MISIEKTVERRERYEFNRPFKDIDLQFGLTNEILPDLDWSMPNIVWLDYTSDLDHSVLQDLVVLGERLVPGSAVCITLKCKAGPDEDEHGVSRLDRFINKVGDELRPPGVTTESLSGWGLADVQRTALMTKLQSVVASRSDNASFEQIMYVQYQDSTRMMAVVGILVNDEIRAGFDSAPFDRLDQYRADGEPLRIEVPSLSAREILTLDDLMSAGRPPVVPGVEANECDAYIQFHRWYPAVPSPV